MGHFNTRRMEVSVSGILQRPLLEHRLGRAAAGARRAEGRLVAARRAGYGWQHERVIALDAAYAAALYAAYCSALVLRAFDEKEDRR